MKQVKVKLIAFDSLGVRSMATVIEAYGIKIFIDPGASYAPRRYGLPPHPLELETLEKLINEISKELEDSTHVIISHYHYDHYLRGQDYVELYGGKKLYIKNPRENINVSQRIRAHRFLVKDGVSNIAEINIADARTYTLDKNIVIRFSNPVPHGEEGTPLGYVVMTLVTINGYRILHASDIQGPICEKTLNVITSWKPNLIILSGPPTYFEGYKINKDSIIKSINNMKNLLKIKELKTLIIDHHSLRDLNYRDKLREIFKLGNILSKEVITAAEYMGKEPRPLEAMRKILWGK